jgi:hypothetical protein
MSSLFLLATITGAIRWWSYNTPTEQILTVVLCLLFAFSTATSLAVGIRPTTDIPWPVISLVIATNLLACGVLWVRYQLAQ